MKLKTTTQFTLAPRDDVAQDGSGLEYDVIRDVIRDVSPVHYNKRGVPTTVTDQHRTRCVNLAHGLSEWWAQINHHRCENPDASVVDIWSNYSITLFHTHED